MSGLREGAEGEGLCPAARLVFPASGGYGFQAPGGVEAIKTQVTGCLRASPPADTTEWCRLG